MHITVHIASQRMKLYLDNGEVIEYLVSTASKGTGQQEGSWQTPMGKHIIRAKIGGEYPLHAVFDSRRFTGEFWSPELAAQNPQRKDWILTRILWLSGTEPGFNRLGNVDTMRRYVYIHGSPDTAEMGKPGSRGCIRMHGRDIMDLYDRIEPGIAINILPE